MKLTFLIVLLLAASIISTVTCHLTNSDIDSKNKEDNSNNNIPGFFGPGDGFNIPGYGGSNRWGNFGGGYGGGYGGPGGSYSHGGVIRSSVVCSQKGPCYKKKLMCPAKCFSSYSRSGRNYGGGGGGGGCTMDCEKKCVAYC